MKASDVMRREVVSLPQNATLQDVVTAFVAHRMDALPVVDAAERVVGLIVLEDLIDIFLPRYDNLLRDFAALEDKGQLASLFINSFAGLHLTQESWILAADIMNTHKDWVREEDSLIQAAARVRSQRAFQLPVVDRDRKLVGLISEQDIVLALLRGSPQAALSNVQGPKSEV